MPAFDSAARAATLRPLVCSSTGGGLDAALLRVAGALDARDLALILLRGTPYADEVFTRTGREDPVVPPAQLRLAFADEALIP